MCMCRRLYEEPAHAAAIAKSLRYLENLVLDSPCPVLCNWIYYSSQFPHSMFTQPHPPSSCLTSTTLPLPSLVDLCLPHFLHLPGASLLTLLMGEPLSPLFMAILYLLRPDNLWEQVLSLLLVLSTAWKNEILLFIACT